jgi:hypothetical protein
MCLFYSYVKCFGNINVPFLISNPLEENTISKLEPQADNLESYISVLKFIYWILKLRIG